MGNLIGYNQTTRTIVNTLVSALLYLLANALFQTYDLIKTILAGTIHVARGFEQYVLEPNGTTWIELVFYLCITCACAKCLYWIAENLVWTITNCAAFYRASVIWLFCPKVHIVVPTSVNEQVYKLNKIDSVLSKNVFVDPSKTERERVTGHVDKPEGAFGDDHVYPLGGGIPKGTFIVYGRLGTEADRYALLGHGFLVDNDAYCTIHELHRIADIRVGIPGVERLLKVNFDVQVKNIGGTQFDTAIARNSGIGSVFGVKGLKWGMYNQQTNVQIFHRRDDGTYTEQFVRPDNYETQYGLVPDPTLILTASNTSGGDSGFCVMQKGKVVAIHLGGATKFSRNVAQIPYFVPEVRKLYDERARAFKPILDGLQTESAPALDNDDKRARDLAKLREEEEEDIRERRMRGEHRDDQGYAESFSDMIKNVAKRKGKKWSQFDDDDFVLEGGKKKHYIPAALKKKLEKLVENYVSNLPLEEEFVDKKESADSIPPEFQTQLNSKSPAAGASEVPPQSRGISLETLVLELRNLNQQVKELEKQLSETRQLNVSSDPSTQGEKRTPVQQQESFITTTENKSTSSGASEPQQGEALSSEVVSDSTSRGRKRPASKKEKNGPPQKKGPESTPKQ